MENYLKILRSVPLFYEINDDDLVALLHCLAAKTVDYKSNSLIFKEGDLAQSVGIVLLGEVRIVKDDIYGNQNIMAFVNKGQLFGEAFVCAAIHNIPVSVMANQDSVVMFINYKKIIATCTSCCAFHNKLIYNMLKVMANKNVFLNQKIEILSKRTTKEKLLVYLSSEAQKTGDRSFSIPFNRQELADYLFVDRSAMSNELCKLRNEGILAFNKNKFKLLL